MAGCSPAPAPRTRSRDLSEREREVLRLMAEGRSNRAIGERLEITRRSTWRSTSRSIFTKLELPPKPDDHRRVLAVLRRCEAERR